MFICLCPLATGFGDPHMITLDGVQYTFNGYGEYHILQIAGHEFDLQGRMQPLGNEDEIETRATVYKAFAMKENGSDVVQVTFWNKHTSNHLAVRFLLCPGHSL